MIFQIGPKHVRIDNFHGEIGSFSYYVLGDVVQIYAATGDIFYVYHNDVTDPSTGLAFATLNAFVAYLDANFFKAGSGSGSGGGTSYAGVSPASRYLFNASNQTTLDWEGRQLLTGSGVKSVDWQARALYNSAGIKGVDYENFYLADAWGYNSVNYSQRLLVHQNGTRAVFWADGRNTMHDVNGLVGVIWGNTTAFAPHYAGGVYGERTLVDGTYWYGRGAVSLDWKNRYLVDGNEEIVGRWNERLLVHGSQHSLNWASRVLYDGSSQSSVNWSERYLMHGGQLSLSWSDRRLIDGSGVTSQNWWNRTLHDSGSVASIDYGARFLNDGYGNPSIDWHNRALMTVSGGTTLSWGQSQSGSNAEVLSLSPGTRLEIDAATLNDDTMFATNGGVQTGSEQLNYYGINGFRYLATPKRWARIDGSNNQQYYLPLY